MINLMKQGYPMYQIISKRNTLVGENLFLDVVCDPENKINIGDNLSVEKINGEVKDILEERPSRGRHVSPKIWQKLEVLVTRNLMFE